MSTVTFESTIDDLGPEPISFTVGVKDIKELVLPEVTDEWATEASEFKTADELKDDITTRLKQRHIMQAQLALQQKTIEALVELVTEDVPDVLVEGELRERIHDLNHRLEEQKIGLGQFLAATGRGRAGVSWTSSGPAPSKGSSRIWLLRALVDQEHIELTDEELDAEPGHHGRAPGDEQARPGTRTTRTGRKAVGGTLRPAQGQGPALAALDNVRSWWMRTGIPVSRDDLKVNQAEEDAE